MAVKSKQPEDYAPWQLLVLDNRLGQAVEEYLRSESAKREVTRRDAVKAIAQFRNNNWTS